jgi:hypothetical protein
MNNPYYAIPSLASMDQQQPDVGQANFQLCRTSWGIEKIIAIAVIPTAMPIGFGV